MKKKSIVVVCAVFICTIITAFHSKPKFTVKAEGTCCPESGSECIVGSKHYSGYYYKSSGPCNS